MACAYVFAGIALISLPAALSSGQVIIIIAWIAQTFLQLVLLSIIMVGQTVQSAASDARAVKEFADTETILDRLDVHTAGGIREVLDAIHSLAKPIRHVVIASTPGTHMSTSPSLAMRSFRIGTVQRWRAGTDRSTGCAFRVSTARRSSVACSVTRLATGHSG